jgi:molybdopterin synthase sulfur carrier subunit
VSRLRLFGPAADAAGTRSELIAGATVAEVLQEAADRFGPLFAEVLQNSKVWLNGEPANPDDAATDDDEIAVLPPVSGGQ